MSSFPQPSWSCQYFFPFAFCPTGDNQTKVSRFFWWDPRAARRLEWKPLYFHAAANRYRQSGDQTEQAVIFTGMKPQNQVEHRQSRNPRISPKTQCRNKWQSEFRLTGVRSVDHKIDSTTLAPMWKWSAPEELPSEDTLQVYRHLLNCFSCHYWRPVLNVRKM